MKSKILGFVLAFILGTAGLQATDTAVSWTAGQNTYKQSVLIPNENARLCARYSTTHPLPGCATADLTAPNGSCVAAAASAVTIDNLNYRSCVIFTQNAAGEAAFDSDQLYQHTIANIANDLAADVALTKIAWKSANQTNKNTACTTIGRPTGCHFYE